MDKLKKVDTDSKYKTNGSVNNNDFKFEIKETLDLPDNTVCYIDGINIPHTWYTVEDCNNKLYIGSTNPDLTLKAFILTTANFHNKNFRYKKAGSRFEKHINPLFSYAMCFKISA